jgi:hypothetical protein
MNDLINFSSLPIELQKNLVSFLDYNDAFKFSQCSKLVQQNLSLSTISLPLPLILKATFRNLDDDHGNTPQPVRPIPLPLCNRVHSVILRAKWGINWFKPGDLPSRMYVIAQRDNYPNRVVYEFPLAQQYIEDDEEDNEEDNLQMSFNPVESENYFIYQKVAPGRASFVTNLTAQVIIFDCVDRYIAKICDALYELRALRDEQPFLFRILKASAQALRTQIKSGMTPDADLVQVFESNCISSDIGSLEAMIEICDAFLENSDALLSHFSINEHEDTAYINEIFFTGALTGADEYARDHLFPDGDY